MKKLLRNKDKILTFTILFINLALFLCGIFVLIIGGWMIHTQMDIFVLMGNHLYIFFGIMYTICGSCMILVSALGFLAPLLKSKQQTLLSIYWKTLLAVDVPIIGIGLLSLNFRYDLPGSFMLKMMATRNYYHKDRTIRNAWDAIQENLECCGVFSTDDWKTCTECEEELPKSCCLDDRLCARQDSTQVYQEGCLSKLHTQGVLLGVGIVCISLALPLIFSMFFCFMLIKELRKYERL